MIVLVTGANGFIGKNLVSHLNNLKKYNVLEYTKKNSEKDLESFVKQADYIIHLAGATRPTDESEFASTNVCLTKKITEILRSNNRRTPIIFTSSTQAQNSSLYGKSKQAAEIILKEYCDISASTAYIYRLPNVFGKWSRPNYCSVVATWCHNIARGIEIKIDDPDRVINFAYIDDVVEEFISKIGVEVNASAGLKYPELREFFSVSLNELADTIQSFKSEQWLPQTSDKFIKNLYSTYQSFLPEENIKTDLENHSDRRGAFFEVFKSLDNGQISLSTSKPGVIRGNHYHQSKMEKFVVIQGQAKIRLRKIDEKKIYTFDVCGDTPSIVNMLPGYTHNIENTGNTDMILLMWANEVYDSNNPDTYYQEV